MKDLQARMERLERENLRMRERLHRLEAMVGAVEGHVPEELCAHAFTVKDPEGRVRAWLGLAEGGPELALFDARGGLRARLGLVWEEQPEREHGPAFTLFDADRNPLASLFLGLDEAGGLGPVLSMGVPGLHPARLVLGAGSQGPILSLFDRGGAPRALLRLSDREDGEPELLLQRAGGVEWRPGRSPG